MYVCNKMLSYGRITFHFRIRVFTHTRWLFSCCSVKYLLNPVQIQNAPEHIQTIIFGSLGKQDRPFI